MGLMCRLGLSRQSIAAAVGSHLGISRRQDPGRDAEHQAAACANPAPSPSPKDLSRTEEAVAWVPAERRLPDGRSPLTGVNDRWPGSCRAPKQGLVRDIPVPLCPDILMCVPSHHHPLNIGDTDVFESSRERRI
jgi:hypothetical protein